MAVIKGTIEEFRTGFTLTSGEHYTLLIMSDDVTCVRLKGLFFDTNKNFLLPPARAGIRRMVALHRDRPRAALLAVGHTDTSGEPSYNDPLSLERADSLSAYLRSDLDAWLARYNTSVAKKKRWGETEDELMMQALLRDPDTTGDELVRAFQRSVMHKYDLGRRPDDGKMGGQTRRALVTEYMGAEGTTLRKNTDVTVHGCGESFPAVKTGDDAEENDNRRVELFIFEGPITPPPDGEISNENSSDYPAWRDSITIDESFRVTSRTQNISRMAYFLRSNSGAVVLANRSYKLHLPTGVVEGVTDGAGLIDEEDLPAGHHELEIDDVKTLVGTRPASSEPVLYALRGFFLTELT